MDELKKSVRGIQAIGWGVVTANLLLVSCYYLLPVATGEELPARFLGFLAMAAAFPVDFYHTYLGDDVLAHFVWISMIVGCAVGILFFNKLARTIFLLLNAIHVVVLGLIVLLKYGQGNFLEYFFKLYFTLVVSGTYMGFLTLPEIRTLFKIEREESRLVQWIMQWLKRPVLAVPVPHDAFGHYNLALAYRRMEQFDQAIKHLKKAIEQKPDQAEFHFALGMSYAMRSQVPEAIPSMKEAIRLDPIHPQASFQLGLLYRRQGCDREAMESFQKACHARPQDAEVYLYLGETSESCARYDQALEAFQKAVAMKNDALGFYHLGRLYARRFEKYKEARELLRSATHLQDNYLEAYFELGLTCIKLEIYKEAIRAFRDVLRLDEENTQAHYQLGLAYTMIQDFESARREYRYLKEVDEDLANNLKMMIK